MPLSLSNKRERYNTWSALNSVILSKLYYCNLKQTLSCTLSKNLSIQAPTSSSHLPRIALSNLSTKRGRHISFAAIKDKWILSVFLAWFVLKAGCKVKKSNTSMYKCLKQLLILFLFLVYIPLPDMQLFPFLFLCYLSFLVPLFFPPFSVIKEQLSSNDWHRHLKFIPDVTRNKSLSGLSNKLTQEEKKLHLVRFKRSWESKTNFIWYEKEIKTQDF